MRNLNGTGSRWRNLTVPEACKAQHVLLQFEGVDSAITAWIGGRELGCSQGRHNP